MFYAVLREAVAQGSAASRRAALRMRRVLVTRAVLKCVVHICDIHNVCRSSMW